MSDDPFEFKSPPPQRVTTHTFYAEADAMSDEIEDIKIGGISPNEYIRGIKIGNIDPTYDNGIKAILWAADEIERLREENRKLRYEVNRSSLHLD